MDPLPKDLAGFQLLCNTTIAEGDLVIPPNATSSADWQWADGLIGCATDDSGSVIGYSGWRVYRKSECPKHNNPLPVEAAPAESEDKLAQIREERGKIYGDPELSHENIGLAWTAAIQQHYGIRLPYPLKPWLVELMMGQFKIQRATRVYHEDNYDDLYNYAVAFAKEHQARDPDARVSGS